MKKVTLSVTLNAQDDFETGDCKSCPVVQKQYEEIRYGEGTYKYSCPFGYTKATCPMEVKQNG